MPNNANPCNTAARQTYKNEIKRVFTHNKQKTTFSWQVDEARLVTRFNAVQDQSSSDVADFDFDSCFDAQ